MTTAFITRRVCSRRGVVLILVLSVLAVLSLLALAYCHRVRLRLKMSRMQGDQLRAYYLALGGVNRALAAILADQERTVDHRGESWSLYSNAAVEALLPPDEDPTGGKAPEARRPALELSYAVSDEESRLNLNTSSAACWLTVPGMTEQLACAILDWQDADDIPTRDGAEAAYYQQLPHPYRAKNLPMTMIWELAMLRNVSWAAFMGEDVNGNAVLDKPEDDGPANWPMDDADGVLDPGFVAYFTTCGSGKVNLNTAALATLAALPDVGESGARSVDEWRNGLDGEARTGDDRYFTSLSELAQVDGLTNHQRVVLEECGSVTSSWFRINVEASVRPGSRPCRLMALAKRGDQGVQLVWILEIGA